MAGYLFDMSRSPSSRSGLDPGWAPYIGELRRRVALGDLRGLEDPDGVAERVADAHGPTLARWGV